MEPSVIAYGAVNGLGVATMRSFVDPLVGGLPRREAVLLDIGLDTMLHRATDSPLSRKDTLIKKSWDSYTSELQRTMRDLYPDYHHIHADGCAYDDVLDWTLDRLGVG
ncbi:hypothetical protein [Streptomyces montanus]